MSNEMEQERNYEKNSILLRCSISFLLHLITHTGTSGATNGRVNAPYIIVSTIISNEMEQERIYDKN